MTAAYAPGAGGSLEKMGKDKMVDAVVPLQGGPGTEEVIIDVYKTETIMILKFQGFLHHINPTIE